MGIDLKDRHIRVNVMSPGPIHILGLECLVNGENCLLMAVWLKSEMLTYSGDVSVENKR